MSILNDINLVFRVCVILAALVPVWLAIRLYMLSERVKKLEHNKKAEEVAQPSLS